MSMQRRDGGGVMMLNLQRVRRFSDDVQTTRVYVSGLCWESNNSLRETCDGLISGNVLRG